MISLINSLCSLYQIFSLLKFLQPSAILKVMKRVSIIIFIIFTFLLISPKEIWAQGTIITACKPENGCNCQGSYLKVFHSNQDPNQCPYPQCYQIRMVSSTSNALECYPTGQTAGKETLYCDECGFPLKPENGSACPADKRNQNCESCVFQDNTRGKYSWTALGCVPVDPQGFVSWLLGAVIGVAGGIVFLLILYGGFQILTSTGDPEKLNSGKEIIVSAIAGLLMIVFSVLLLKIIGVDILKIPGFQ